METLYADRLGEQVERLAHHAARGELGEKAVVYLRQAGAKAFANSAHSDALAYFTQAPRFSQGSSPGAGETVRSCRCGSPWGRHSRPCEATPRRRSSRTMRGLGSWRTRSARRSSSSRPDGGCGWWHRTERTRSTALERGRELLALAERLDDPALLLEGHHALWPVLVWLGKADAARHHLDRGMALYDKARHRSHAFVYRGHDPGVCCRKVASWAPGSSATRHAASRRASPRSRLARELAHPMSMVVALVWACVFRDLRREFPAVREHARALIALSTEHDASTVARGGNGRGRAPPAPSSARERRRSPRSGAGSRPTDRPARNCSSRTSFLSWPARTRRSASLTRVCASSA